MLCLSTCKATQSGRLRFRSTALQTCFINAGQYSVREAFEGSTVLITGATGKACHVLKSKFLVTHDSPVINS